VSLKYLVDTHVVVWWLTAPRKLSREQNRILAQAERSGEQVGLCATTLMEIATLRIDGVEKILKELETGPLFRVLPITIEIALDAANLAVLRDPGDRAIVASARVLGLRLLTRDERIIASKLVPVVD
jgi:PIN domain nuclease of toxin-antitoxin system